MIPVSKFLSSPDFGPVHTGMIAAAQSDPAVAEARARDIIPPRVVACRKRRQRACEQGQVRADVDLDTAVELLYGPSHHRVLLHTRPLDAGQVTTVFELAFRGLSRDPSYAVSSRTRSSISMHNALEATG